jgi:hypothetical protein
MCARTPPSSATRTASVSMGRLVEEACNAAEMRRRSSAVRSPNWTQRGKRRPENGGYRRRVEKVVVIVSAREAIAFFILPSAVR